MQAIVKLKIVFCELSLRELSSLHVHCPCHKKCDSLSSYVRNLWLSVKTVTPSLFLIALMKSATPKTIQMTWHWPCIVCMCKLVCTYVQSCMYMKKTNVWPPFWKKAAY